MREGFPTQDDLVAYLRGRLPAAETQQIDGLLARDEALRGELARTREVLAIVDEASDEAVIRRVDGLLAQGFHGGASDLHLDLTADGGVVRLRIDGVLQPVETVSIQIARAMLARLMTLAEMPVADLALPADGRFMISFDGVRLDLRCSYLPGIHGGRFCVRYLSPLDALLPWDRLGFLPAEDAAVRRLMNSPYGLGIVSGPTGSGKTTVLYRLVAERASSQINVMSIEDPVEIALPWVAQTPLNVRQGLTFPVALRAMMRQDPDVLLVGEIRDYETLQLSVQAALTGHLVLTTIHAPTVVSAIRRLQDVGLDRFLISNSLATVIACRLVRCLCPQCSVSATPRSQAAARQLGVEPDAELKAAGPGCDECRGTGYRRRRGIYEVGEITPAVADAIAAGEPDETLRELLFSGELPDMRRHGAAIVRQQVTSAEEVARVLSLSW